MSALISRTGSRALRLLKNHVKCNARTLSQYYTIDENVFGLSDHQKEVSRWRHKHEIINRRAIVMLSFESVYVHLKILIKTEKISNTNNFSFAWSYFQLRTLVFNFAQKELAPRAAEIDKNNNFDDLRVRIFESFEKRILQSLTECLCRIFGSRSESWAF